MKKTILLIAIVFIFSLSAQSQGSEKFVFQKIDTINLTKEQIFDYTKEYIADLSNNAKFNTQNEDKDRGIIQLNASTQVQVEESSLVLKIIHRYTYHFDYKFQQKDNKYNVEIYNVICKSVESNLDDNGTPLVQPFMGEKPINKTFIVGRGGIKEKTAIKLMTNLKNKLNGFLEDYDKFLRSKTTESGW